MSYTRVNWQDAPSVSTPLSASNLNKMDAGIEQNANDIEALQQHTYDSALDDTSTNAPQTKVVKKAIEDAVESVTIITDPTLSNEGQAADAKATGEAVAQVKSAINLFEDGFEFGNQFVYAEQIGSNQYASISNGKIALVGLAGYNAYLLPVDGVSTYTFTDCRFAFLVDADKVTAIGNLLENVTSINSTGASYIAFSFNYSVHPVATYICSKGNTLKTGNILPGWASDESGKLSGLIKDNNDNIQSLAKDINLNVFQFAELLGTNKYATIVNGKLSLASLNPFNAYLLPVDGVSKYYFTDCRWAFLVDTDKETAIGELLQSVYEVDSTGASYIAFSFNYNSYPIANYHISIDQSYQARYSAESGTMTSGNGLYIADAKTCLRKGERIVFSADIVSFNSIKMGLCLDAGLADSNQMNTFLIDNTNISYYATANATPIVVPHGLTVSENIQIVWKMTETASCIITLISDGTEFKHEFTGFVRQSFVFPYVLSVGSNLSECKLAWTCSDILKGIWMFGDSYFGYSIDRWTYYLHQFGYDNHVLLDGFPGEGSQPARASFSNLVKFGRPKMAVYCVGMNDASDSSSAPSSAWVTGRDWFLRICKINGIIPVFGTIPTVPTINHEQKNAWIRSSGYRYIDFAKAVGAQANGTWYTGMLSDGIHPTAKGAKALCARALLDLPELMVDRFDL